MSCDELSFESELDRYHSAMPAIKPPLTRIDSSETLEIISLPATASRRASNAGSLPPMDHSEEEAPKKRRSRAPMFIVGGLCATVAVFASAALYMNEALPLVSVSPNFLEAPVNEEDQVSSRYSRLASVSTPFSTEIPLLWDIPGDGDVYQLYLSKCFGLVAAGGALGDPRQMVTDKRPLEIFEQDDGTRYVNVYPGTMLGLERARERSLVESEIADVLYAPLIYETMDLFSGSTRKGKLFALFHHPVQRVYGVYRVSRELKPYFNESTTVEDFLRTDEGANNNNWMTRELAGGISGPLDEEHFQAAKAVLREKCLVGLSTDLSTSLERLVHHFAWSSSDDVLEQIHSCRDDIETDHKIDDLYFDVWEDSPEWDLIAGQNEYDMRLHEVVELLFKEQAP